jgi:ATP phosphoribosyltransferase
MSAPKPPLRIAIPSKGRLRERAVELLVHAGLRVRPEGRRLHSVCSETGIAVIFAHTQDIPALVAEGAVDLGITGSDVVLEKGVANVEEWRRLGFGRCRLSVAVHVDAPYQRAADLGGKRVGTKFTRLAAEFFAREGARGVHMIEIQGAVEAMVPLGLVDAIVEIVETGTSLVENDLRELAKILDAETVLIGTRAPHDTGARDRLLRRIDGVLVAARYSLVEYNCPAKVIDLARQITPGFSAPTIQQTGDPAWLAVKVLVEKAQLQGVIDRLEEIGCVAILETELRHARL